MVNVNENDETGLRHLLINLLARVSLYNIILTGSSIKDLECLKPLSTDGHPQHDVNKTSRSFASQSCIFQGKSHRRWVPHDPPLHPQQEYIPAVPR